MKTLTTTAAARLAGVDHRRTITAKEAAAELGIPTGTIRGWASAGRLFAVSIGPDGQRWYLLSAVLELAATTRRRAHAVRPSRRRAGTI